MRYKAATALAASITLAVACFSTVQARELTFEERVQAQEAIERVYYSHQIGATKPFEETVPREVLEQKVRTYLLESAALERLWKTPVTPEALDHELARIARNTRFPERLLEIYAALDHDAFLVAECFARPVLAERLAQGFFAYDARIHGPAREEAEALRTRLFAGEIDPQAEDPRRSVVVMAQADPAALPPAPGPQGSQGDPRLELPPGEFTQMRAHAPRRVGEIGPVEEDHDAFTVKVVLAETPTGVEIASYSVPKLTWEEWWERTREDLDPLSVRAVAREAQTLPLPNLSARPGRAVLPDDAADVDPTGSTSSCVPDDTWLEGALDGAPPGSRTQHTAVWTGSEMIVWGGWGGTLLNSGSRYDPVTDSWTATSMTNVPDRRYLHTAVWTGTHMVVWGGWGEAGYQDTGGGYDPASNTWTPTSTIDAPTARSVHTAVWTGTRMIVWGGHDGSSYLGTGSRYDPATDTWAPTSTIGAPAPRYLHTAVFKPDQMIVWGGYGGSGPLNSGAWYDTSGDFWVATPINGAPEARYYHTAVWTGTGNQMVVWGGIGSSGYLNTGGRLLDGWTPTPLSNAPQRRYYHTAVWTGSRMLIWGGASDLSPYTLNTGDSYDPGGDQWTPIDNYYGFSPAARYQHTAVWTGNQMIVWGGSNAADAPLNTGARHEPATLGWTPTTTNPQLARFRHTAVWTGNLMIVWGGLNVENPLQAGSRYDPTTDHWNATSQGNAPTARFYHSAVWAGSVMIVWGGSGYPYYPEHSNTGGRYDPIANTWTKTTLTNAPSGRQKHTAVWTGSRMVVWGGSNSNTGGRYDPVADNWTPTTASDAPSGREDHTAVWTGSEMIVWGGNYQNTGGRYDPIGDAWTPTTLLDTPTGRRNATAVWTGNRMIVWGGTHLVFNPSQCPYPYTCPQPVDNGGRYDPSTDSWAPTSTVDAPSARTNHTAVWTGGRMVVWGGSGQGTGARYDPAADSWTPTSLLNAPTGRESHTAVWTGNLMVVWGGSPAYNNNGGRYTIDASPDVDLDGFTTCAGDCDDADPMTHPSAAQICDGANNDCGHTAWPALEGTNDGDHDGDAFSPCQGDCDDDEPTLYPGALQLCDGLNNDCTDPAWPALAGTSEVDDDGDSLSDCQGDCDDAHPSVYPAAAQLCDGLNNDCADPAWPAVPANEGDGDLDDVSLCAGDCNDASPAIYPGAPQLCDGLNNDCSAPGWPTVPAGEIDVDGDGFRPCQGDCDDGAPSTYPGAPQACDGVNSDCADPGWPAVPTGELDDDDDGVRVCAGDCDDANALVWTTPGEVPGLTVSHSGAATEIAWNHPLTPGGAFVLYDTLRSSSAFDFVAEADCVESSDGLDTTSTDLEVPLPHEVFFYLVRAENSCPSGMGSLGEDSSGNPRVGRSCP